MKTSDGYPLYHLYIGRPPRGKTITQNSESLIFYGIAKVLIDPKSLEEMRQTWTMFSQLKALVDSEKSRGIVFKYSTKNDNSELGIFTSKHDSMCHRKIANYRFMYRAKTDNSEHGFTSQAIPKFSSFPRTTPQSFSVTSESI